MQPQTLFTNYIIAGITALLVRVQAAAYVVPEADRQQAWHLLSFGLKLDDAWPVTRELLLALAPKMELAGFREEWIPYLVKGIQCAQKVGDEVTVAEYELAIGLIYHLLRQFDESLNWIRVSFERFRAQGDIRGQARTLNELAWIEHLEHRYKNATKYANQALRLLPNDAPERAMSYRVRGMIAFYEGNLQKAINHHRQALKIFEQNGDQRRVAWSFQNIAIALQRQDNLEEAFDYYEKAVTILTRIGDTSSLGIVELNLGSAYNRSENQIEAIKHLLSAEEIANKHHDPLQRARINTDLGLAYLSIHRYAESEQAFQIAIEEYSALGHHNWRVNAMDGLAMTYLASKQYPQAITVLQQALAELPKLMDMPNYGYLQKSLRQHLSEAEGTYAVSG